MTTQAAGILRTLNDNLTDLFHTLQHCHLRCNVVGVLSVEFINQLVVADSELKFCTKWSRQSTISSHIDN